MNDRHLENARRREPTWDAERHDRVKRSLGARIVQHDRRRRFASVARSSLMGMALLALAVRAFASPTEAPTSTELRSDGPRLAYDDGGFRADVMRD